MDKRPKKRWRGEKENLEADAQFGGSLPRPKGVQGKVIFIINLVCFVSHVM